MSPNSSKVLKYCLLGFAFSIFSATSALTDTAITKTTAPVVEEECLPGEPCSIPQEQLDAAELRAFWKEIDNPSQDGWDTEVFNSIAGKQLKVVGKMLTNTDLLDAEHLSKVINTNFITDGLRPEKTEQLTLDNIHIDRAFNINTTSTDKIYQGQQGALHALQQLAEPFEKATDKRFKFKIFRVNKSDDGITTRQYFALLGKTSTGIIEHNATWDIQWLKSDNQQPKINTIKLIDFEEIVVKDQKEKLFVDVTGSVLEKNQSYHEQLLHGYPDFLASIENLFEFNFIGTPGIATGDINGDGLDDIYVCQEQGIPNLLYIQEKDGSLRDISAQAGVNWLENSRSALLLDFDNDGDQDLAVTIPGAIILTENDGSGKFKKVASLEIANDPMSMASADYDMDGDLDIYVTLYNPNRVIEKKGDSNSTARNENFIYHDANNGPPNNLFRNDIVGNNWQFTDVTDEVGLNVNNSRFSFSAAWEDYDNDGDQDLYVANDYGRDNLYRNELIPHGKASFSDVSDAASIENSAGSMGITWADYNKDGYMDAFINAMWSSAGNRVTFQDQFTTQSKEVKRRVQRFAHGNTMMKNNGDGTFSDASEETGTEMGRWAWNSNFVDLNNDSWEDLVVSNGYLTGDEKGGDL